MLFLFVTFFLVALTESKFGRKFSTEKVLSVATWKVNQKPSLASRIKRQEPGT